MLIRTFHFEVIDAGGQSIPTLETCKSQLKQAGFVSLSDQVRDLFDEHTASLGFQINSAYDFGRNADLFSTAAKNGLCSIRKLNERSNLIEVHLIAPDEANLAKLSESATAICNEGDMREGAIRDVVEVTNLKKLLEKRSPNGKLLDNDSVAHALDRLYDPEIRSVMRPIVDTWGEEAASLDLIEDRISGGKGTNKRRRLVRQMVKESELFDARYVIACSRCETSALEFESEAQAKDVLKLSIGGTKCKYCEEGDLRAKKNSTKLIRPL